ncbi:MAG: hypothetical protein EPN45_02945 [Rhizobiaceae bacterium]|nr:MAG: hypothetical protein EPN45_02945 [Rhizobiaceae bacterium]
MPLQNRVDPFGDIHAVEARGMFTGNRGVIHDPATKTLRERRWTTSAWLICVCEFKGRHREVMGRNTPSGNAGWTELFFLDEVTALAAGHRPCFYCQRERAKEFARRYGEAFGKAEPRATEIDGQLHRERRASGGAVVAITPPRLTTLPDGAMVALRENAFAWHGGKLLPWSFRGYGKPVDPAILSASSFQLLTPKATLAVLKAGFRPVWHETAGQ